MSMISDKREGERRGTNSVGHEKKGVSSVNSTRLDLSNDDSSEIVVLLRDGEHEGSVDLPIGSGHAVQEVEKGGRPGEQKKKVANERRVEKKGSERRRTDLFQGQISLETCSLMLAPV